MWLSRSFVRPILSRILQLTPERKVVADKFADGSTLGRINDLAADGHGGAYYTQGGLFHAKADGTVDTIAAAGNPQQGGLFTNGLELSPDGKTLYVTNRTTIIADRCEKPPKSACRATIVHRDVDHRKHAY